MAVLCAFCANFACKLSTAMSISRINLSSVDSTNSFVREMLAEEGTGSVVSASSLPGFTLVVADDQTKGRGQQGNAWETERGKNLIFSLLCQSLLRFWEICSLRWKKIVR